MEWIHQNWPELDYPDGNERGRGWCRYTCCSGPAHFCTEHENATKITEISFHQTNNFFSSFVRQGRLNLQGLARQRMISALLNLFLNLPNISWIKIVFLFSFNCRRYFFTGYLLRKRKIFWFYFMIWIIVFIFNGNQPKSQCKIVTMNFLLNSYILSKFQVII